MDLWRDVRLSLRNLRRTPGYAAAAIMTLALAIAANTAIFSAVYALLLKPLPIRQPDELVVIRRADPARAMPVVEVSFGHFRAWRDSTRSFSRMAAFSSTPWPMILEGRGDPAKLQATAVSSSFFDTLGVKPLHGRLFTPEDDTYSPGWSAILSYGTWMARFGGDPDIVGKTLALDRKSYSVVGVMPRGFDFPLGTDLWTPVVPILADVPEADRANRVEYFGVLYALGRLRAGVAPAAALDELNRVLKRTESLVWEETRVATVTPLLDYLLGSLRQGLWVMFAAVLVLLLVGCANVSGLVLTRATLRRREHGIRLALGARRLDLARSWGIETLLVALTGGIIGLVGSRWIIAGILALAPDDVPRLDEVAINPPVALFTCLVITVAALLCGAAPIAHLNATNVVGVLGDAGRATTGPQAHRTRSALVMLQIGLSVVLLIGAAFIVRSFVNLQRLDPGFRADGVLSMELRPQSGSPPNNEWFAQLIDRVVALPGVEAAGAVFLIPLAYGPIGTDMSVVLEHQKDKDSVKDVMENPRLNYQTATPGYFRAMRIPVVRGRGFDERDRANAPLVALVSETAAARLWPGQDPIGRQAGTPEHRPEGWTTAWHTVIGVVKDVHYRGINDVRVDFYEPAAQSTHNVEFLTVRSSGNPLTLAAAIGAHARALDPRVVIDRVTTMEAVMTRALAPWRLSSWMLALFAALAFVLSMVGLVGVVSLDVAHRTREFAVRMALGASRAHISRQVVAPAALRAAAGVAAGLAVAAAATQSLRTLLFGVDPGDPAVYVAVVVAVCAAVMAACYLPARRATTIDPMSVLKRD